MQLSQMPVRLARRRVYIWSFPKYVHTFILVYMYTYTHTGDDFKAVTMSEQSKQPTYPHITTSGGPL